MKETIRFTFGKNWQSYSKTSLTPERIEQARRAFHNLVYGIDLHNKTFIDIGYGQGLSLIIAAEMGAKVLGIDVDRDNVEALRMIKQIIGYPESIKTCNVSILDDRFIEENRGRYDIVHSWGVLHHTGNMMRAIVNACALVADGGHFICAIYNRHWTSPVWKIISMPITFFPALYSEP